MLAIKGVSTLTVTPKEAKMTCGNRCQEHPEWVCSRAAGHPGRHESEDGGDWHDDASEVKQERARRNTEPKIPVCILDDEEPLLPPDEMAHKRWN